MESFWILYWITRLDSVVSTLTLFAVLLGISALISAFVMAVNLDSHGDEQTAKTSKKWLIIFSVLFTMTTCTKMLVPSKEDAMLIVAGVGITEAVKSETAQRLASKSVAVVEKWLDEQTKDKQEKK